MISYIKGEIVEVLEDRVIIDNQNIGYNILVPASMLDSLPGIGNKVKIYTYLYVREDAMNLYGFLTRDDLMIFKLLIGVNGIGPKGALGILSTVPPDDLRIAVLTDDVKTIQKAPGIGAKTAQKLIIELKDKLKLEDVLEISGSNKNTLSLAGELRNEAIQALVALGYSDSEAVKAVKYVSDDSISDVEGLIKAALKKIGSL